MYHSLFGRIDAALGSGFFSAWGKTVYFSSQLNFFNNCRSSKGGCRGWQILVIMLYFLLESIRNSLLFFHGFSDNSSVL